jgi:dihydrofolate synthase/folylpolyglutamate synthase
MTDRLLPVDAALERLKALHPKKIDLSLGRMKRLCAALGHPERKLPPVVHVAGTNGKGSTVAFVRAIAEAAGLKVHVYTSPHLVRFAERIRVAGALISDDQLSAALDRVEAANAGQPITFFEVTTAAAFTAFADTPADVCVLEVGLGGALDATNVIERPAVSVITPVDYDHREFLGDTIEQVAAEKAGILKAGAPAVIGRQRENALAVIESRADKLGVPLTVLGRDFDAYAERDGMVFQGLDRLYDLPRPSLAGPHQIENAALAIVAAGALGDPRIDSEALAQGIAHATWPGRFQHLTSGPLAERAKAAGADLVLDGGHNAHAAKALARAVGDLGRRDGRPPVLITGMLANKDALAFFSEFAALKPPVFTVPVESEAATEPRALAQTARMLGLEAEPCDSLEQALQRALATGGEPPPRVLICGSLYLVGEALSRSPETWPK